MATKVIIKDKILEWLVINGKEHVSTHELIHDCANWCIETYGLEGNLAIERKFRELKEEPQPDLLCEEIETKSRQSTWRIISFKGKPWGDILKGFHHACVSEK